MRLAKQLQLLELRQKILYIISFVPYSISINQQNEMNHTQSLLQY